MAWRSRAERLRRRAAALRAGARRRPGRRGPATDAEAEASAGGQAEPEPEKPVREEPPEEVAEQTSQGAGEEEEEIFTIGELRAPEPRGRLGGFRDRLERARERAAAAGAGLIALRRRRSWRAADMPGRGLELRRGLAAAGDRLRSGAAVAGGGLAAARDALDDAWLGLSRSTRQRITAGGALALLAALFVFVFLPNAPCGFPGGDRCPPDDDAIGLAPIEAGAYLHANLDLDTDQIEIADGLAERLPTLAADASGLLPVLSGTEIDFERDVRSWSGGEVAGVVGPDGSRMAMFEARDAEAALEFGSAALGPRAEEEEIDGVTLRTHREEAAAVAGGFLLLGDEGLVRAALARDADPAAVSLADNAEAARARAELPEERIADLYLSAEAARFLAREGELGGFNSFINSAATEGAAAAAVLDEEDGGGGLTISVRSLQDPESEEAALLAALPSFEAEMPNRLRDDTYLYLGLGDPGSSAAALIDQAASVSPPLRRSLRAFGRRISREGGVDVGTELPGLLPGEAALTIEPKAGAGVAVETGLPLPPGPALDPPYLGLVADGVDPAEARETLARLQAPLTQAIDPGTGQVPTFQALEIDGVEAHALRLSPSVELTYAIFDGLLVAGSDPAAVARIRAEGASLEDSDRYRRAVTGLGDEFSLLLYLDLPALFGLGEEVADLALIPAYARLAPELRQLEAAAMGIVASPSLLATDLRVRLGPEDEGEGAAGAGATDPG